MHPVIRFPKRAAVLAALCLTTGVAWADSVADLKSWLRETRTLKADFAQTSVGGIGGGKSQGTMAISRPGKFRWSITKPYTQLMVGDGSRIWLYDPELKQVIVRPSQKALGVHRLLCSPETMKQISASPSKPMVNMPVPNG